MSRYDPAWRYVLHEVLFPWRDREAFGAAPYGMPIGGVLFADRAVVPYAIGVDIGCGVALVETELTVETLSAAELQATLEAIAAGVPVGISSQPKPVDRETPR